MWLRYSRNGLSKENRKNIRASPRLCYVTKIPVVIAALCLNVSIVSEARADLTGLGAGARASVLGESFVAIADDVSALYWNPAGISRLHRKYNVSLAHTSLFRGLFGSWGVHHDFLGFVRSSNLWGIGLSIDRLGTDKIIEADPWGNIQSRDLEYAEWRVMLSGSKMFRNLGAIGITGKGLLVQSDFPSDGEWGIDVGILTGKWFIGRSRLRIGVTATNVFSTSDVQFTGGAAVQIPSEWGQIRPALAYSFRLSKHSQKAVLGLEWRRKVADKFPISVALGLEYYPFVEENLSWRIGLGIGMPGWERSGAPQFGYSYESHKYLSGNHRGSLDLGWGTYALPGLIENLRVGKIYEDGSETETGYETTDTISVGLDISRNVWEEDVANAKIELVFIGPDSTELERITYRDLEWVDAYRLRYEFGPIRWLKRAGHLRPGRYTARVYAQGKLEREKAFQLDYDGTAKGKVGQVYHALINGEALQADSLLSVAVNTDPSYPNTYYVAGVISELRGDFKGATKCYEVASKLAGAEIIMQDGVKVDIGRIAQSEYLKTFAEKQTGEEGVLWKKLEEAFDKASERLSR